MNRRQFLLAALQSRSPAISREHLAELRLYNATVTKFALASGKFDGLKMKEMEDYINKLNDMPGTTYHSAGMLIHCYRIATTVAEARI